MNRRQFLRSAASLAVLAAVPGCVKEAGTTIERTGVGEYKITFDPPEFAADHTLMATWRIEGNTEVLVGVQQV